MADGTRQSSASLRDARQEWLLLGVNGLFVSANALSSTFVNVYLWKIKNDLTMIGWFAVVHQIVMALTFWLAGKWVKEGDKLGAIRIGIAVAAAFYGLVLLLGPSAVRFIPLLGTVQGISSGLFWLAYNIIYFEATNRDSRDRFNGRAGLLGSGSSMLAPWLSGIVIARLGGTYGYRLIFSISVGVFIAGVLLSFLLKRRPRLGSYEWSLGLKRLRDRSNPWRTVTLAMVAQGLREGIFGFMITLLVYISTGSELRLGNYTLYTSAVGLVSFWLIGRMYKPAYRKWGLFSGALMLSLAILPLFWNVGYATLLVFGIATSLFMPLYTIPVVSFVFDLIGQDKESAERRVESVITRELALNAGRLIGTIAFIAVVSYRPSPLAVNCLLLVFGSSPLLVWWLLRGKLGQPAAPAPYRRTRSEKPERRRSRLPSPG
ncbi:MFS transporter [Cohnella algarum]|uniref:MFS transporter n=1 Tax=Cohnella algarum TaxID=2044859 RepID=UPI001967503E|nr:MFS transporter [Cohnella algarum]MBN2980740.1 MFS transporter [Cohnella algarum]